MWTEKKGPRWNILHHLTCEDDNKMIWGKIDKTSKLDKNITVELLAHHHPIKKTDLQQR